VLRVSHPEYHGAGPSCFCFRTGRRAREHAEEYPCEYCEYHGAGPSCFCFRTGRRAREHAVECPCEYCEYHGAGPSRFVSAQAVELEPENVRLRLDRARANNTACR
jgi:hypothetical protein